MRYEAKLNVSKALICGGLLSAAAVSGCATDTNDLFSTATTAATSAYLTYEDRDHKDFARAREFADNRSLALRRDAARGEGEHINTFAALLNEPDADDFGAWMQANYSSLYTESDGSRDEGQAQPDLVSRIIALR